MTSDVATDSPTRKRPPDEGESQATPPPEADAWSRTLARFSFRPRPRVSLRERLVPDFTDSTPYTGGGWLPCILVTLVAGFLRFFRLGQPDAVIFDETYYAKDGWSLVKLGYEGTWQDVGDLKANDAFVNGDYKPFLSESGSYIVHPPIGKWTIGLGEWMFGVNPFGWRFMVALLGTLSVLMLCRIGRRLFRSTLLGCIAGLLLALDGLHFVMSRTALLDLVLMFWVLAAFGALVVDRDDTRATVARRLRDGIDPHRALRMGLGLRPWRIVAGICMGLACGTKWSGVPVVLLFIALTLFWDAGTRRAAGAAGWRVYTAVLRRDLPFAFLSIVVVALIVYVWSWSGWLLTDGGYHRQWADGREGLSPDTFKFGPIKISGLPQFDMTWVPEAFRSLWHYHGEMWKFHNGLDDPHVYQSNPWSWMVLGRPVSYYFENKTYGQDGCDVDKCAQEVLGIGTPFLWWAGVIAFFYLLFWWAARRDWRAGAILCGLAAGLGPWMFKQDRTIFLFYAVVFVPFIALAVAMMIGAILGPPGSSDRRRAWGAAGAVTVVVLIAWNFLYFYPIFTGTTIPLSDWQDRMWWTTWI
ncbi:dolichyl-phosphate-mannose--protein mannosyltransferase [Yinghuangia soli]|uniref:Polyprenol-phosphate-mannose--protein mannosyltransferase n=1 Tax=Yinghuangia soli TaxID=2908204 RepID=A0AA41Q1B6_9ACTN|nr:phospholipid carrier-dependent glycosyltransferase [Yinghuangia soli]MCF2528252.1 phospholipid carrier-dependent glycosyltransferase [Yinghuangia soli]